MNATLSPTLASPASDAARVAAGETAFIRPPTVEEVAYMRGLGRYVSAVEVRAVRPGVRARTFHGPQPGRN